jgi:hypothetical protein
MKFLPQAVSVAALIFLATAGSAFGATSRIAATKSCDLELKVIDNEGGDEIRRAEALGFPKGSSKVEYSEANEETTILRGLKNKEYGVLVIAEGFKNSFFRFDHECGKGGSVESKPILVPMWKGEESSTMVLEFLPGRDYLQLKDLGLKDEDGKESDAPTKIKGGVINGRALRLYRPEYSEAARGMGARGTVQVKLTIWYDGTVREAEAISGPGRLRESAVRAAKKSVFAPTFLLGVPLKVEGVLVYSFN